MNGVPDDMEAMFAPGVVIEHSNNRGDRAIDMACAVVTGALLFMSAVGWEGLARVLLTFAFAVYVPGWAIVANCGPRMRASRTAVPVLVSVSVLTAAATITLWLHAWHPLQLFDIEAGVSIALMSVAAIRRERRPPNDKLYLQTVVPGNDG